MNRTLSVKIAFGIVVISILSAFLVGSMVVALSAGFFAERDLRFYTLLALFFGQSFMVVPLFYYLISRKYSLVERLRLKPISVPTALYTILFSLGIIVLADELSRILIYFIPASESMIHIVELLTLDFSWATVLAVLSVVVLAPLAEELLFRGFLQKFLEEVWGDVTRAVLITSLFFAVIHLSPFWMIQIYFLGVILGYLAWRTGSILSSFILHGLNNGVALILTNVEARLEGVYLWKGHVSPLLLVLAGGLVWFGLKGLRPEGGHR